MTTMHFLSHAQNGNRFQESRGIISFTSFDGNSIRSHSLMQIAYKAAKMRHSVGKKVSQLLTGNIV